MVRAAPASIRSSTSPSSRPSARATSSCSSSTSRSSRRPVTSCSACRASRICSYAVRTLGPGAGATQAAATAWIACTSRRPPRASFRSGSSRKASSPLVLARSSWAACSSASRAGAADRQSSRAPARRRSVRSGSPATCRADSSPSATFRSARATRLACGTVRTAWSSSAPESQTGYQMRSAMLAMSSRPPCSSSTSRSLRGSSSRRPYPPIATRATSGSAPRSPASHRSTWVVRRARSAANDVMASTRVPRAACEPAGQIASGPRSPVRTLTTVSTGTDQTLPSPIRPVCAALSTTPIRSSASSSSHRTSTRTFGTRSTWYSAPRYTSVCPRCLPYPLASVIVRPWTPNACKAALTSSSLNGLMTAVMSFIWCPFGVLYRPSDADVSPEASPCVGRVKHPASLLQPCFRPPERDRSAEDGVHEGTGVERGQVVRPLAEADELDRNAQLTLHRDDDPALGRAVQLGQHDPGDVDHLGEHPGLAEPVLPGGRVEHQQDLVDRGLLLHHALDLAELVHQPDLGVQAAGGVHDHHVDALVGALAHRVEGDAGRVGAVPVGPHGLCAHPLPPRLQLVGRRGAERVGRAEQHGVPVADQ